MVDVGFFLHLMLFLLARQRFGWLFICSRLVDSCHDLVARQPNIRPQIKDSVLESRLLARHITELAARYRATKFCAIRADAAIENYPDRNVPTLLVYGQGDMRSQLVTLATLGGEKTKVSDVEKFLERVGAITVSEDRKKDLDDEDDEEGLGRRAKIIR